MGTSARKKNISTVLILVIVLLVPGFLYIALNKVGSNAYLKLPIYGEKVLSGKMNRKMGREIPDTTYHQISAVTFVDSKGDSVYFLGQDTVVSVVHLFYTRDSSLSVGLAERLKPAVERFKNNNSVKFYSISVDPYDSPENLANFAKRFLKKDEESNWSFVVRPDMDILTYSRQELLLEAMRLPEDSSKFIISPQYILVDPQGRIRGFYDINLKTDLDRLEDEIKVQLVEEIRNNPFKVEKK